MTSDWPEFEACIREKITQSNQQLELTGELYALILLTDPNNTTTLMNLLTLEKLLLKEIFKLLTLTQKYRQSRGDVLILPQSISGFEWN